MGFKIRKLVVWQHVLSLISMRVSGRTVLSSTVTYHQLSNKWLGAVWSQTTIRNEVD